MLEVERLEIAHGDAVAVWDRVARRRRS